MTSLQSEVHSSPRGSRVRHTLWFVLLAAVVYVLDRVTKHLVVHRIELGERIHVMPLLEFRHIQNRGIAFGLLADKGMIVLAGTVIVGALLLYTMLRVEPGDYAMASGAALICGGAVGNLVDRLRLGYVTDFLHLPHWPTFNVADMGIVVGVGVIILVQIREAVREAKEHRAHRS